MTYRVEAPGGCCAIEARTVEGQLQIRALRGGVTMLDWSPVGLRTDTCDMGCGVEILCQRSVLVDESYTLPAFKKAVCRNHARGCDLQLRAGGGLATLQLRAYDDGVAFRLTQDGQGTYRVLEEGTGFALPEGFRQIIGMKHGPSYEDHHYAIPREELPQNRLAMPVLLEEADGSWMLLSEAAVFGDYGGSSLLADREHPLLLRLRQAGDQPSPVCGAYPLHTPWRVAMMGGLKDLVESNLLENLNPPSRLEDNSFVHGGLCAWNWLAENESTTDPVRIRQYVDYAAAMGYPYYLADYGWQGHVDIPELVRYAGERQVRVWLWEHSADIRTRETAEEKMRRCAAWGVAGLKIDFFESDGQERLRQMDMLAETAAHYRLMLNFHGCTKPAGEIRTWPHVLTREAVQGAEYLQHFSTCTPMGVDAVHDCTLPFTRNVTGPMDYTPVVFTTLPTGTTDVHQAALPVIFTSYLQHISERAEIVLNHPLMPFLRGMPAAWDETRLLEGYPGSHVTMARRKSRTWYVAGICAQRPRTATVTLDFLEPGQWRADMYLDGMEDLTAFDVAEGALPPADQQLCDRMMACRIRPTLHNHDLHLVQRVQRTVSVGQALRLPMAMNGGFAMVLSPMA